MNRVLNDIGECIELFEAIGRRRTDKDINNDVTSSVGLPKHRFSSIRRLKMKYPDYRSSPVKIYTKEEIADYEQNRHKQTT